jgi:hypothetical protein
MQRIGKAIRVNSSQSIRLPKMEHLTVLIPSTSQPAWGGYSIFDLKEKGASIHEITIKLNISPITGLTGTQANFPNYNPAFFFLQRLEIVINNNIIDTIYPEEQWLRQQLFEYDERRKYTNVLCGDYANPAQRALLASVQNDYYIPLWSFFKQTHLTLINTSHEVQLRCYWNTSANNINVGTLTGTALSTINSGVLLVKLTRHSQSVIQSKHKEMIASPVHSKFTELRYGTFVVNAGTSSTNIVLTSIVGPVAFLIFIVRNSANLSGTNYWNFQAIKDWAILDASSTNITGGVQITHAESLLLLNKDYVLSSYSTENSLSSTNNNNANVYIYGFSGNVSDIIHSGRSLGYHYFQGNEQILLNFNSQLTANVQVDVYAYCDSAIEQHQTYVKKISVV